MSGFEENIVQAVAFVHEQATAVATGSWRYENKRLYLEAFRACAAMNPDVVQGFQQATADVPVTDTGLGIVLAARSKEVTEYRAEDLPPDSGSGFWLRNFPADRSVAVPQLDAGGNLVRILSVAVLGVDRPPNDYAWIIREAYRQFCSLN